MINLVFDKGKKKDKEDNLSVPCYSFGNYCSDLTIYRSKNGK